METEKLYVYLDAIEADSTYYDLKIGYRPAKTCGTPHDSYQVTLEFSDSIFLTINVVDAHPLAWINYLVIWNASRHDVACLTLVNPMLNEICDRLDLLPLVKRIIENAHPRDFYPSSAATAPTDRHISI